ncbi:hypothetical protein L3X38_022242 [Prunus dulcis]|uniref:PB1-like domain-containing protein n=1 Tax=Prunus dulcis TaxID=3755 RepID=A0AAD4VVK5_PRUDU|nr:hypothetical protein L3X38_022242 [Prunus dulcis]
MFTLEVHHGGYFVDSLYMRGIVQWVDGQDAYEVSMLELFEPVKHLGYDEQNIQYYYKHMKNGWVEIRTDNDYFGALKFVKSSQLFVLYITDNPTPRPLNVQSPVFTAQGENAEHFENEDTPHGYDGNEENGQYEFVDVEIDEEFGEAKEEVETYISQNIPEVHPPITNGPYEIF